MSAPTLPTSTSPSAPAPMTITSSSVPDLAEVRAWIEQMIKALRFVELVVAILGLITRMRDINLELMKQVVQFRRARPRSETLRRLEAQQVLPFMVEGARPEKPKKPKQSRKGKHPGRAALPAHLPREVDLNAVSPAQRICPLCGAMMTTVGHDICEILEVHPARVYVRQRMDECVACPNDDTIVSAKAPPQIVERGKLGDTLIIEAVADKFIDHQPTERQSRGFSRDGVDIPPQTLGRSMAAGIDLFSVIASEIKSATVASALLGTDATGLPVLDQDHEHGIRNGTIWCWVGDQKWVTFFYARNGDAQSVRDFLGDNVCRTVQCDGTSILNFIERAGGKRPGCWAHGRRRFVACARSGDQLALVPLRKLRRVFAVERLSATLGDTPEQRLLRRTEHSAPVIAELRAWLDENRGVIPPKTPLGQALGYLHRQWSRLVLFLTDGRLELTNNRLERELRALVLGRKNWLFAYGDLGGQRTAMILTVVGTCIAHRINPRAYLHVVAKLIVNGFPQARVRELLPDQIVKLHPELRLPAPVPRPPRPLPELPAPS
jgi:transposase